MALAYTVNCGRDMVSIVKLHVLCIHENRSILSQHWALAPFVYIMYLALHSI